MAAVRLIAMHRIPGRKAVRSFNDRLDYAQNPAKTNGGELVSSYLCDPATAGSEFNILLQKYLRESGHDKQISVIAYQIRQSFKPGEITSEEANRVGYETAMRWTRGQYPFTVSTHVDRHHIHNHIIYSAVNESGSGKWREFHLAGLALQKLSDIICTEHHLSVIAAHPGNENRYRSPYAGKPSNRGRIRKDLDHILAGNPKDFDQIISGLISLGYECKRGKYIAVRKPEFKTFIRLRSLGKGYTEDDLRNVFRVRNVSGSGYRHAQTVGNNHSFDLMIDIKNKLKEGKGRGYERWAKSFNLKQTAEVLCFLKEHDIHDFDQLVSLSNGAAARLNELSGTIKNCEKRMHDISSLRTQIINYVKTKDVYSEYRKAGYSRKFLEFHRQEILIHQAAKKAFDESNLEKLPKVKELNDEFQELLSQKRSAYSSYREARKEMQLYSTARRNVEMILEKNTAKDNQKEIEKDKAHDQIK